MAAVLHRLLSVLAVLALAACSGMGARHRDEAATFGIVTFNLYHDKADWPARRALIVPELRAVQPDMIVLQEVLQDAGLRNQADDLAEALGYSAYFVSIDPPGRARRYGNAILTRHPVLARDWTRLRPLDDSRTAGMVRIDLQRERLLPVEARIVLDREGAPGTWSSDHFGLYVRFAFAPSR